MEKLKLLYDVVMAMRDKKSLKGTLKVECSKDQAKIFELNNTFEKEMIEGKAKANISLETDCAGKKLKHESSTEFDFSGFSGCRESGFWHHGAFHRWRMLRNLHGRHDGMNCCEIKGKLGKLAFLLNMLQNLKVEEQEDKSTLITFNLNDISGEMKTLLREKFQQHSMFHEAHCSHGALREFTGMEIGSVRLTMRVNKNNEAENILLNVEGNTKEESGAPRILSLRAELNLTW